MNRICPKCKKAMATSRCMHCLQDAIYQDVLEQSLDGVIAVIAVEDSSYSTESSTSGTDDLEDLC